MTGRVEGKIAIVSSAASFGMGFATASVLARGVVRVVLTGLDAHAVGARLAARACRLMQQTGSVLDLRESTFGAVDILVNNAGITVLPTMAMLTPPTGRGRST
jgi:NAD(P)-dependent dehydrogenase (short-subunit alcohol dehydrogenase family)